MAEDYSHPPFAETGEQSEFPFLVLGNEVINGWHSGAGTIREGGELVINGVMDGALRVMPGGTLYLYGTLNGALMVEEDGHAFRAEDAEYNGATTDVDPGFVWDGII